MTIYGIFSPKRFQEIFIAGRSKRKLPVDALRWGRELSRINPTSYHADNHRVYTLS